MADVSFSSINVVSGQELGETPQVYAQPGGKRAARAGETLVVFLDLPNAPTSLYIDIARTLSDAFWRAPGGLTTALRLAIKMANDRLLEANRGTPATQRVEGSISCAVVNDDSVVIAQAGPAIAYARAQTGAFERVIPESASSHVGSSRSVEAYFTHFTWNTGDSFVLTGQGSIARVPDELVNACMSKGEARLVAGYLNANVKEGRMVGVALSVGSLASIATSAPVHDKTHTAPASAHAAPKPVPAQPAQTATPKQPSQTTQALASAGATAGRVFSTASRSIQRSLRQFGGQLLPTSVAQASPAQRSRATVFGLAAAAILLPIAVALITALLYFQLSGEAEKQQLRNNTRAQIELAQASNVKTDWENALSLVNAYDARYPDDVETFAQDKIQVKGQLDQINKVTRVAPALISNVEVGQLAPRITAAGQGVYVLDPSANTVFFHGLNAQRTGLEGSPAPITPSSGDAINTPIYDIAWATTAGGRWSYDGALVFGKSGIFEHNSATSQMNLLPYPTGENNTPGQVTAGELYNNTAYVLDSSVGQIWRFSIQQGRLVRGDTYFRSGLTPLKDGIDFAIDGAVYVLQKSGNVLKYFNREPLTFTVSSGMPGPMGKVTAIALNGADRSTGSVFIADSDSGAIWQFSKVGAFIRQYRGVNEEFIGLSDMSLDSTTNTLYISVADKIYSFKVN